VHKFLLAFFTYLIFITEGTIIQAFQPNHLQGEIEIVPHFVLVVICFIAIFLTPKLAIIFGISFGLFYDFIYTDLIGVYAFSFAFISYFATFMSRFFHGNLFIVLFSNLLAVTILEFFVYGIYLLIGHAKVAFDPFLYNRLIPTLILNGCFTLIIFYPLRKQLYNYAEREQGN
jgi:rod shape-determining protein MreD